MRIQMLLVLAALAVCISNAGAQVRIGVFGGVVIANVDVDPVCPGCTYDTRTGEIGGLAVEIGLARQLSLYLHPRFVMRGSSAEDMSISEVDIRLGYVELPIGLKYRILPGDIRPYIFAGIVPAGYVFGETESQGHTEEMDDVTEIDVLLDAGAGIEFVLSRDVSLFFDGSYNKGFVNINDDGDGLTVYNNGFILKAGLLIEL